MATPTRLPQTPVAMATDPLPIFFQPCRPLICIFSSSFAYGDQCFRFVCSSLFNSVDSLHKRNFWRNFDGFWRDFGGISCMDAAMQWERERPRLDFNYFGGQATIDWYQSAGNQSDRLVTINVNLRRFIASGLVNITLPSLTGNKWYFVIISIIVIHFFPFTIRYEFKRQVEPVALETARWLAISPTLVWRISWISHPKFAYYVPESGT